MLSRKGGGAGGGAPPLVDRKRLTIPEKTIPIRGLPKPKPTRKVCVKEEISAASDCRERPLLRGHHFAMDPDAVHDAETEHDHEDERAAITD